MGGAETIALIAPLVAAILTAYFVFAADVYPRTKAIVAALVAISFALTFWFVQWYLAGLLLQVLLVIGLLMYFKMRPD